MRTIRIDSIKGSVSNYLKVTQMDRQRRLEGTEIQTEAILSYKYSVQKCIATKTNAYYQWSEINTSAADRYNRAIQSVKCHM